MEDLLGFLVGLAVGLVVMDKVDSVITNHGDLEEQREAYERARKQWLNDEK